MTSSSGGYWPGPAQANGHRSNSSLCRRGKSPGVRIPATQVQRDRRSPGPIGDVSSGAPGNGTRRESPTLVHTAARPELFWREKAWTAPHLMHLPPQSTVLFRALMYGGARLVNLWFCRTLARVSRPIGDPPAKACHLKRIPNRGGSLVLPYCSVLLVSTCT